MQTALRVLTALTEKRKPDPADLEMLGAYAPLLASIDPDELACEVLQQALKRRAQTRAKDQ
jgi:hypothetical protein